MHLRLLILGHNPSPTKKRVQPIIRALRGIYFTPRGTLKVLAALAEGVMPDPADIEDVLTDFNDHEWHVARHLDYMEFDRSDGMDLSLRQRRTLTELAYGKKNLRREIQDALNMTLGRGLAFDRDNARVLLRRVEALNSLIESLEEELL
ncbi:MAG: hypothetical protein JNN10_12190 [Sphingopyxis sp.]|uniref:hypothetical protein n=1 Tax=Sphingopyxis sp. TaxID=1908224 RepID=UPI001A41C377|nr:hypothetical protein [Sphingopyxis sp.]MBL9067043.1 hypothetical protein [Sphingopyxis sp.]